MEIVFSKECLEYDFGKGNYKEEIHPEKPSRVSSAYKILKEKGYKIITPEKASGEDLLLVHSQDHIMNIKHGNIRDIDTPFVNGIYEYAALAVGGAIKAGEIALEGKKSFSLMRPPGHHASMEEVAGFCYFNNIAVSAAKLLKEKKIGKIAILDIDLHHGNGTEEIFSKNRFNKNVLYVSLHSGNDYPNTGWRDLSNCINFPLTGNPDEKQYLKSLEDALNHISDFKPEMLAVSAGFDTYKDDPVPKYPFLLEITSFGKIGQKISNLNMPTFCVMEGGYNIDRLGECVYEFISGLGFRS